MKTEIFGLLALESTNIVMKLEKELLEKELKIRIIPVPKEVTANCGLSIKFQLEDIETIKNHVGIMDISCEYYKIVKTGLKKEVEKLD